jgi:hypothetical protein
MGIGTSVKRARPLAAFSLTHSTPRSHAALTWGGHSGLTTSSDEGDAMPIGIRFSCEECGEESVVAVPATHARYGLVDCLACGSAYLVLLSALEPAVAPATVAS